MDPLTPLTNARPRRRWYRQGELLWAGRSMMVLMLVVIGIFYFGILCGIGGQTAGKGRVAALGFAGILAILAGSWCARSATTSKRRVSPPTGRSAASEPF